MLKGPEIIDSVILCSGRNRDFRRKNTLRDQVVSARSHLSQASSLKQEEHVVRFDSDHPFEREKMLTNVNLTTSPQSNTGSVDIRCTSPSSFGCSMISREFS